MPFPPLPAYPKAIDNDYTLFLVYNTTEARLTEENAPWSLDLSITPVGPSSTEIWGDNGFATIEGEMFYYDSVELNEHGKVHKLKGCARNLAGEKTRHNKKGTWVRGYVVAEHHNQIVESILRVENFVGRNFDPRVETLDWRIRNLQGLSVIFDDFACPDINFTFNVIDNDPVTGVLAQFDIAVTPPSAISNYRLDFGDGEFTTTQLSGTHQYALNANIDPVITVSNDKCQAIQTPITRANPQEPPAPISTAFDMPVPEIPDFPDFNLVPCTVPEPDLNLPPLVVPCTSFTPEVSITPSVNMVSVVTIINNIISPVVIDISGISIPSVILIEPPIPPTIIIDPPIPPTIIIIPPPSSIMLELDMTDVPKLEIDWGKPPPMQLQVAGAKPLKAPQLFNVDPNVANEFGEEFADLFDASATLKVEAEPVGIPSRIEVFAPDMKVDASDLNDRKIKLDCSDLNIPASIKIYGPDSPIPDSIKLDPSGLPEEMPLVYRGDPVPLEIRGLPESIAINVDGKIPDRIIVEIPKPIPERIVVEASFPDKITLVGPDSIPISIPEGLGLPVLFPDKMPEIELVYRGAPIDLKINIDEIVTKTEGGQQNCFMLTPCPR